MQVRKESFLLNAAVDTLRDGISRGRWQAHLPGLRQLRQELGINRPTLEKALGVLSGEGWVGAATQGQRRPILFRPRSREGVRILRAGLMIETSPQDSGRTAAVFSNTLQLALEHEGWSLEVSDSTRFARILESPDPPEAWVIYDGTRELIEKVIQRQQRAVFLGGPIRDLDVDIIARDGDSMVTEAMRELLLRGHRRIVLPLKSCWQNGRHGGVAAFVREMQASGIPLQDSYHLPPVPESPTGFRQLLEGLWKWTPPTAMLVHHAAQAVEVLCFLAARGGKVPDDLSLVVLDHDPLLGVMSPPLCSVSLDCTELVPHVVQWLTGPPMPPRKVLLPVSLAVGGSIAPPRGMRPNDRRWNDASRL